VLVSLLFFTSLLVHLFGPAQEERRCGKVVCILIRNPLLHHFDRSDGDIFGYLTHGIIFYPFVFSDPRRKAA
jgi:hypothetical protein